MIFNAVGEASALRPGLPMLERVSVGYSIGEGLWAM
jgi:hypothetical protein